MEKKCEICGCPMTAENGLIELRVGDAEGERTVRTFCEICLSFGAEMYESYMETRKRPASSCGKKGSRD